jgi:hypothetical protein
MVAIAEAYRDLTSEFRFSFLLAETMIQTEAAFTGGTVAVTSGSAAITLTPGADALTWDPTWTNRRIQIAGRTESYKVAAIGTTLTATLASPWAGDTNAAAAATMYRSVYGMPPDCDYGCDILYWDALQNQELTMISTYDMKRAEAYQQGQVGTPIAVARVEIQADGSGNPIEMVEFGPQAPRSVFTYPAFYYRKPPAATGTVRPIWPESYEDLIWRRGEINLEQNPRHRIAVHPEAKQLYHSRLWDVKRKNDGGAEIYHRIARHSGDGWSNFFRNVGFTGGGINPLVGG